MSKGGTQTTTQKPDQFSDFARQQLWNQATQVANQPYQPYTGQGVAGPSDVFMRGLDVAGGLEGRYGDLADNLGFGTTPFSADALKQYQDPYEQQVISGVQGDFQKQRDAAMTAAAQAATAAGAFGGSRSGVLQAEALKDVNANEANTLAALRSRGFSDAANRFGADRSFFANLGLGGLQGLEGVADAYSQGGQYLQGLGQQQLDYERGQFDRAVGYPQQQLGILAQILGGSPQGYAYTQPTQGGGLLGTALGLGSTFAGLGGIKGIKGLFSDG